MYSGMAGCTFSCVLSSVSLEREIERLCVPFERIVGGISPLEETSGLLILAICKCLLGALHLASGLCEVLEGICLRNGGYC